MEFKRCSACGEVRDASEFAKHRTGLQSKCKPCNRIYQRAHYRANKADYIAKANAWMTARKNENARGIIQYFFHHPCVDCGEADPIVLQFDHVRGRKTCDIAVLLQNGTNWTRIQGEIAKCDVRCANCHWRRHALLRGWRKLAFLGLGQIELDLRQPPDNLLVSTIDAQVAPSSSG